MSGIAGIVRLDGGRIDAQDLRSLTQSLAFRGPDRQDVWIGDNVGLGHAELRTTDDVDAIAQPTTLDGSVWITADARLDGRAELIHLLDDSGRHDLERADDSMLILHAYHAWGENCVDYLIGDFSFAIWNRRTRHLFCARDHFGVKPFYYACTPQGIVFSNTLNALRGQAGVSSTLNELAVADFLLFGINQDPATTIFADIKRLPPGHTLIFDGRGARTNRYWSVPIDGRIRYRRSSEYVEHFRGLLERSVADRLRSSRIGVWMSGGLDSTSITALARKAFATTSHGLCTHTIVYDELIPDEERHYSGTAARSLGVEHSVFVADSHRPFDGWDHSDWLIPEPTGDPFLFMRMRQLADVAAQGRVLLCGEGGDEVLWPTRALDIARSAHMMELTADLARSVLLHRRRPAFGVRAALRRRWRKPRSSAPPFPDWINETLTSRLHLRERWEHAHRDEVSNVHPLRPQAYRRLSTSPWSWYFESSDPGVTRLPVEVRYPFLDLRLVKYLLAIPPIPWCIDKEILRRAMRGVLPDSVRLRPKSPLGGDPLEAALRQPTVVWPRIENAAELAAYVNPAAGPITRTGYNSSDPWLDVRPVCFSHWLSTAR